MLDRDGDGVSDLWQKRYPTAGVPVADPDGDGQPNRAEALAGTDPLSARSCLTVSARHETSGATTLRWPGHPGKIYRAEHSTDLRNWADLGVGFTGTGGDLSTTVPPSGAAARGFWRIVVADADADSDGLTDWEESVLGSSPTAGDSDRDGMPDLWEATYGLDPIRADATANSDGDEFNNLEEYLAGLDPTTANPRGGVSIAVQDPAWGIVGSQIVLAGDNLSGATAVRFNGVPATTFTVDSVHQISAVVPAGAATGPVAVNTPSGSAVSPNVLVVTTEAACLRLAQGGHASATIVVPADLSFSETYARDELTAHLRQLTGAEFSVVEENDFAGGSPAIYLGPTAFARHHGIDPAACGDEEGIVRTVAGNLVLAGGRARGTLYAVYEFLERTLGCHWLAWDTAVMPLTPDLRIPPLDLRIAPAFAPREVYTEISFLPDDSPTRRLAADCALRNRAQEPFSLRAGGYLPYWHWTGTPHTFYRFVDPDVWFDSNPEYFSMNEAQVRTRGIPVVGAAGSGLCLKNPEVPGVAAASIGTFVTARRAQYLDAGLTPSELVDFSVEDNTPYLCRCEPCRRVTDVEASPADLLVEFINDVAARLQSTHPGLRLRTLAYGVTPAAPVRTRPSENVVMWWTDNYGDSDCFRPLTHPINRAQLGLLDGWAAITPHLQVWDYWNMGNAAPAPTVPEFMPAETIAADVNTYRDRGVEGYFTEYELGASQQSFYDLGLWLGQRLLADPNLPPAALLGTFFTGYYGPAAGPMREYHDLLAGALRDEPESMRWSNKPSARTYVNLEFLQQCRDRLLAAEQLTAPGSRERLHVWQELVVVTNCILYHWKKIALQSGREFPASRAGLVAAYAQMRRAVAAHWQRGPEHDAAIEEELAMLTGPTPALPPQWASLPAERVFDFPGARLAHESPVQLVDDPDAASGKAICYAPAAEETTTDAPPFGIYDRASRRSGPSIAADQHDGRYHWYEIGTFTLGTNTIIWGHETWYLTALYLDQAFLNSADPAANTWRVMISVKTTGYGYQTGQPANAPRRIWVDRVVLVRPD